MTKQKNINMMDGNNINNNEKTKIVFPELPVTGLVSESRWEPNCRLCSFRQKRQHSESSIFTNVIRTDSFPRPINHLSHSSFDLGCAQFKKVRSFKMTTDVLTNKNDLFRRRKSSGSSVLTLYRSRLTSDTSEDSALNWSCSSTCSTGYYRVSILGASGVGKTSLKTRFMSSEYMSSLEFGIDDYDDRTLSVVIDNEESTLEFDEYSENEINIECQPADAYIVIFSVHEYSSFDVASLYLQYLRNKLYSDRPIILVANKVDLVRKRQISADAARQVAKDFNCKYVETSAVLNHNVDELLVGILKQIKLKLNPEAIEKAALMSQEKIEKRSTCKGPKRLLSKLFRRNSKPISQCDNLFDL